MTTTGQMAKLPMHSREWFTAAFENQGRAVPANLQKLSERLCRSYAISGQADPMYIVNVIAVELGLGDGRGNFGTAI